MAPSAPPQDVTELLVAWSKGDDAALAALVPIIYEELRRLARHHMRREHAAHTLETTALVNEAYLKLIAQKSTNWQNRTHFFAASAQSMRRILVDMARARKRQRRGGGAERLSLEEGLIFSPERASELVALDDALAALERLDWRKSRVVELRFFGGLRMDEIAGILRSHRKPCCANGTGRARGSTRNSAMSKPKRSKWTNPGLRNASNW